MYLHTAINRYRFFLFCFFLFIINILHIQKAHAQFFQCTDSSVINPYFYCDTTWAPVCGCDNKTYRNLCEAYNHNGIINYTDRACEDITLVHLYPIPVRTTINYRIYTKAQEEAYVYIYNMYGAVYYYRYFRGILDDTEILDLSSLPNGMYIFMAVANGHFAAKKFVKIPY